MDMIIRRTRISDEQPLMDIGIADGRIVAIEEAIEQQADQESRASTSLRFSSRLLISTTPIGSAASKPHNQEEED